MRNGYVYFILQEHERDSQGYVKVGWALNPYARLTELQTASPYKLTLIGMCKGTRRTEARAHSALQLNRIRGEWFALDDSWEEIERLEADGSDYSLEEALSAVVSRLDTAMEELSREMAKANA